MPAPEARSCGPTSPAGGRWQAWWQRTCAGRASLRAWSSRGPGLVATRRALAGIEPGGTLGARARRLAMRLLGDATGQALPLVLGLTLAVVVAGLFLALLGSAATSGARLQRAADLAAVSAARSMRDDHDRLFLPARLPSGRANPAHLSEPEYRDARSFRRRGCAARQRR